MLWVIGAGASASAFAPQDAAEYQQQVIAQLDAFREALLDGGYHPVVENIIGAGASGERQRVSVTLQAGTTYGIGGFCDDDCSDLDLRLYDGAGRELISDLELDDYPALDFTPDRTAGFEIEVDVVTCASQPCYFGFSVYADRQPDRDHRLNHAGRLMKGDKELANGEYYDRHAFRAEAGQRIVVDMTSSQFDTYIILRDPDKESTENDDHEGSTEHSRIDLIAGTTGTWELMTTSLSAAETGDYRLDIQVGGGGTADSAAASAASRSERGTLQAGDATLRSGEFVDSYTVEGRPGQRLRVDLSSNDFDTYVIVAGPEEDRAENDDATGSNSAIDMELTELGTYEVMVTSYQAGETGAYELTINVDAGPSADLRQRDVQQIAAGQTASGSLGSGDGQLESGEYRDFFVFDGTAGQSVVVDLTSSDFDTYVGVVSPSGDAIENDDFEGSTNLSRVELTLPESGRYRVVATSYAAGETGSYEVTLRAAGANVAGGGSTRGSGNVYGVFVGVSDYPGTDSDLAYTADDAHRVAEAMRRGAGMRAADGIVLTDADATTGNVRSALRQIGSRTGDDDLFVFFFSGHGDRVPRSQPQRSDPDSLDETIEMYDGPIYDDEFSELLSMVPAGTSLIILDACFSGGFAKDVISHPGRMGLFSSEEDVTSQVAAKFRAGGYLAQFVADAVGDRLADADGDRSLTAIELSQYLHERYRVDVKSARPDEFVRTSQLGYQHLVVDRGSISPYDILFH